MPFEQKCDIIRSAQSVILLDTRRKRLSTGSNFVHVYIETWDKGILKFNKFSM